MEQVTVYSDNAERAVIAALIVNPGMVSEIDLAPDDFYIDRNRVIFSTIKGLAARGIEADFVTLVNSLEKQAKLEDIGGIGYLAELTTGDSMFGNSMLAGQYAISVRDYGRRRRAIQAASRLATAAYNLKSDLDAEIEKVVKDLAMDVSGRVGAAPISYAVSSLYDEVQELIQNPRGDVWGLATGLTDFDKATGGLQDTDGEVMYIAGEPGVGKSILSMQIGLSLALQGIPGAIYSLEMMNRQVVRRMVSAQARIETRKLKTGKMSPDEVEKFVVACERVASANLFICESSTLTTRDLRADIAKLKATAGIRWFVLDYLYLLSGAPGDEIERTAELSRNIKQICKDYRVAGITVNSITKAGMDVDQIGKRNIRGSGQVIHDADVIILMTEHQPRPFEVKSANLKTCAIGKGRDIEGAKLVWNLYKHDNFPLFENVTKQELNR